MPRGLVEVEPRRLGLAAAAAILVLGLLGGLDYLGAPLGPFDLDAELTVPAAFSAALLLAASVLALRLAASEGRPRRTRSEGPRSRTLLALRALGAFFAFMALDEIAVLHEHMDDWFGIDNWVLGYLPLAALAGVAWLAVLVRLDRGSRRLWAAGAAAWVLAAVLELPTQGGGRIPLYGPMMVSEELLEMAGSVGLGLALLMAGRGGLEGAKASQGTFQGTPERAETTWAASQQPSGKISTWRPEA
jgi:hypothetical protein